MYCPSCGTDNPVTEGHCRRCGATISSEGDSFGAVGYAPEPVAFQPLPPLADGVHRSAASPYARPRVVDAGLWLRFLAAMVDSIIIGLVLGVVWLLAATVIGIPIGILAAVSQAKESEVGDVWGFVAVLAGVVILVGGNWLYSALFESSPAMATPGKQVMRIVVTDEREQRLSFSLASARFAGKLISIVPCGAGFLLCAFTARRQALHDLMVATFVLVR